MSDDTIEVESCWTGEAGARKCLNQALHLVGLNDGPLGNQGVEIMVGEKQKIAKEHKVILRRIASDCLGLPMITSNCLRSRRSQRSTRSLTTARALRAARDAPLPCMHTLTTALHPSSPQLATKSCSTDHTAIFKRLANEDVEIVGHGI